MESSDDEHIYDLLSKLPPDQQANFSRLLYPGTPAHVRARLLEELQDVLPHFDDVPETSRFARDKYCGGVLLMDETCGSCGAVDAVQHIYDLHEAVCTACGVIRHWDPTPLWLGSRVANNYKPSDILRRNLKSISGLHLNYAQEQALFSTFEALEKRWQALREELGRKNRLNYKFFIKCVLVYKLGLHTQAALIPNPRTPRILRQNMCLWRKLCG